MNALLQQIPAPLVDFLVVVAFSFSIGLEEHKRFPGEKEKRTFGTDRTFLLIGVLGYLLLYASPADKTIYITGLALLGFLLTAFYISRIFRHGIYGFTSVLLALITYGFPLLVMAAPHWLSLLFFVVVIIVTDIKKPLNTFTDRIDKSEFLTLAKFLIITGVVLPLLPDQVISEKYIPVSPYRIWLAVVVVSAISYLSYLLRKYVFPNAGLLLTGILGGLYSSTASTVILAKKSREDDTRPKAYAGAIIMATAMMFLRIFVLILIFNLQLALQALPYFMALFALSLGVGFWFYHSGESTTGTSGKEAVTDNNPLEFKVAVLFSVLYVLFSALTQLLVQKYGAGGLKLLSFVVGFTDIDPFLLNLFQGHYNISGTLIIIAGLQACGSNNILKGIYAAAFGGKNTVREIGKGFALILLFNVIAVAILYFLQARPGL